MSSSLAALSAHSAHLILAAGSNGRVVDTHPFGMGRGFLALALLFGGAFAIMVLIGHLAHRGDDPRPRDPRRGYAANRRGGRRR